MNRIRPGLWLGWRWRSWRRSRFIGLLVGGLVLGVVVLGGGWAAVTPRAFSEEATAMTLSLLSDPFLLWPTPNSVQVVWFTEFEGQDHWVEWGEAGGNVSPQANPWPHHQPASTSPLSRSREDAESQVDHPQFQNLAGVVPRPIWRHQATIAPLSPGQRYPYRVVSQGSRGERVESPVFTLAATPVAGQGLRIWLTSDHQNLPMVAANGQKVQETLGQVDAVFCAGDLINVPDRASEWFDHRQGNGFFPALQGRAHYALKRLGQTTTYHGGELIQYAPLFPAIGNHEVMGRWSETDSLRTQYHRTVPRSVAEERYLSVAGRVNPGADPQVRQDWIVNQSFNTQTYEEIFGLPQGEVLHTEPQGRYYAVTLGDVRLVTLYVTQVWRSPSLDPAVQGRYQERQADLEDPDQWGHGQHSFEGIEQDSPQYQWLGQELASEAFRQAKYTVVMLHHPPHTLGDNIVPAFTPPVPRPESFPDGRLKSLQYDYPRAQDVIVRDLVPLLESAGVDLVLYGHSHLWNRFTSPSGTHYLETSNVGNSYGAFWKDRHRPVPTAADSPFSRGFNPEDYIAQGDPNGLEPIVPTIAPPLVDDQGQPLPYLDSNDLTAFSILDTAKGTVSSYYFDTRQPDSAVVKFDEFALD